jgi:hypothetical protein
MPLFDELDFAANALKVSYRGSDEAQELSIQLRLHHPEPDCIAPGRFHIVHDTIDYGGASGAEFHPRGSNVDLLAGDIEPGPEGPELSWLLRVTGVSPLFVRNIVERMRIAGDEDNPVVAMSIQGSLPLDHSPLSVREADVRAWLESAEVYPGEFPDPGFPITQRDAMGASIRVRLKADLTEDAEDHFHGMCFQWLSATHTYADRWGDATEDDPDRLSRLVPKLGARKRELRAYFEEYTRLRPPARAVLVNMLCKFHHCILPIERVDLAL